jgi:hypothetical protein
MDELKNLINEGKKAINRIINYLDEHKLEILDFNDVLENLTFLQGYAACLEKQGGKLKD